jgi:hypothetical protein
MNDDQDQDGKQELRREREAAAGLWPIGRALTVAGVCAVTGLVTLTVVALAGLGFPHLAHHAALSVNDLLEILKLVLGTVAGVGALAALVMNYRKQRLAEAAEVRDRRRADDDRVRVFNERFAAAAAQLGHEEPAVRLAGVHAMAGLADDWKHGRQTCIDVLCSYLQMPYEPDPGPDAPAAERLAFGRNQKVRHTVIAVITAHLQPNADTSWQGYNLDFNEVRFDGGRFTGAIFTGPRVWFGGAEFAGSVSFDLAKFVDGQAFFHNTKFIGGHVSFHDTEFTGGRVYFTNAKFTGGLVWFRNAKFTASERSLSKGMVSFHNARFAGGNVHFYDTQITGGRIFFDRAKFTGGRVHFHQVKFSGGRVSFNHARLTGGLSFSNSEFTGGTVDLRHSVWSTPPSFGDVDLTDPPAGLQLPPTTTPPTATK